MPEAGAAARVAARLAALNRPVALIGLMGAGKSRLGRDLAERLGWPFRDADDEIAAAAGCSIAEIFERFGEAEFREGERRVIRRLVTAEERHVLATGGGAFMTAATRELLLAQTVTVWLRCDLDVLVKRTQRRGGRPLLDGVDPRAKLSELMAERHPVYAQAHLAVDTDDGPPPASVDALLAALDAYLATAALPAAEPPAEGVGGAPPGAPP